ncbi:hypothetical protein D3C75_1099300 [compost metagenome]
MMNLKTVDDEIARFIETYGVNPNGFLVNPKRLDELIPELIIENPKSLETFKNFKVDENKAETKHITMIRGRRVFTSKDIESIRAVLMPNEWS